MKLFLAVGLLASILGCKSEDTKNPNLTSDSILLQKLENPHLIGAKDNIIYAIVAPYLTGIDKGISGIVAYDLSTNKLNYLFKSVREPKLLLPESVNFFLRGDNIYWQNGSELYQTNIINTETKLLYAHASTKVIMSDNMIYSFDYNNSGSLVRFDLNSLNETIIGRFSFKLLNWVLINETLYMAIRDDHDRLVKLNLKNNIMDTIMVLSNPRDQLRGVKLGDNLDPNKIENIYILHWHNSSNKIELLEYNCNEMALKSIKKELHNCDDLIVLDSVYYFTEFYGWEENLVRFNPKNGDLTPILRNTQVKSRLIHKGNIYFANSGGIFKIKNI